MGKISSRGLLPCKSLDGSKSTASGMDQESNLSSVATKSPLVKQSRLSKSTSKTAKTFSWEDRLECTKASQSWGISTWETLVKTILEFL